MTSALFSENMTKIPYFSNVYISTKNDNLGIFNPSLESYMVALTDNYQFWAFKQVQNLQTSAQFHTPLSMVFLRFGERWKYFPPHLTFKLNMVWAWFFVWKFVHLYTFQKYKLLLYICEISCWRQHYLSHHVTGPPKNG